MILSLTGKNRFYIIGSAYVGDHLAPYVKPEMLLNPDT